eukprot:610766-Prorocentrum_lima.AAC.1
MAAALFSYAGKHGLKKYSFDGCRYGLRSPEGMFARKPWAIMTKCELQGKGMQRRCRGNPSYVQCRGELCKNSENYTSKLARRVHELFGVVVSGDSMGKVGSMGSPALPC